MIRSFVAALVLSISVLLAGHASAVTLNRGNDAEPDTLDPHKYGLIAEATIHADLFETLVSLDAKGNTVPGIAESWTVSPDGKTYTFKLREGLKWSDGAPLTAEDVIAGIRRGVDPKTAGPLVDLTFTVKNAQAVAEGKLPLDQLGVRLKGPNEIEIELETPSPIFIDRIAGFPMFAPLPRHVFDKAGNDWVKPGTMVSNGAYMLAEWIPQDRVRLVKNPHYREADKVAIDEVTYSPTSDEGAALKRFRNGELDVNPGFPPSQYPWMKTNMAGQYFLHPASTLTYILLNQTKPPFNDARVRRALSLALDRETITDRVLAVGQTPAYDFVPKIAANWSAPAEADFSARPLAERLEEARALLAEAGYGPANPLTFRFDYVGSDTSKRIVVAIQSMWAVIGIKAELQANELKSQIATVRAGGSDTAMLGWAGNPEPEFFKNLLRTGSETNFGHYSNAEFDRLTDEAVREMDLEKRKSLFQQADIIAMKEAGLLPLFFGAYRDLVQPWVKGFEPNNTRTNLTRFLRVEK